MVVVAFCTEGKDLGKHVIAKAAGGALIVYVPGTCDIVGMAILGIRHGLSVN